MPVDTPHSSPLVADSDPAPSTAAIRGHPIHPMLVPFPLAFLVAAFATDLAYWFTAELAWATASLWLLGAGFVMGLLAAGAGLIDFVTVHRVRHRTMGWVHAVGNATVLILAGINWAQRLADTAGSIVPWGLVLSLVIVALLGITGWAGGELSYRYRVGVMQSPNS